MTDHSKSKPMFFYAQERSRQNGYALWATQQPKGEFIAISLADPYEALLAFFGIQQAGHICGIVASDASIPDTFIRLTKPVAPTKSTIIATPPSGFLTFTSGSTGTPKIIQRHPKSWLHSFAITGVTQKDTVAVFGQLDYSLTAYAAVEAWHQQADLVFLNAAHPDPKANPTRLYVTPTQLRLLVRTQLDWPDVRLILIGGGTLDSELLAQAIARFPNAHIQQFYGTAEASFVAMSDADTPKASVGKAFPGAHITISEGRVKVDGPMLFDGYVTNGVFKPRPSGPVATGELGQLDQNDNLFLTGRADRCVNVADQLVNLDSYENQLRIQTQLDDLALIALPDPLRGYKLAVMVDQSCMKTARSSLPGSLANSTIGIANWPRLRSGKTDYVTLEKLAQAAT